MPEAHIVKWGNSLAVRIPKPVAEAAGVREGDPIMIEADEGHIKVRRKQRVPTLKELVAKITAAPLGPHDHATAWLLGEVSTGDHEAGRGMRSSLVLSKETSEPGTGFFALAEQLGKDVSDPMKFWVTEMNKVYADWAG